MGVMGDAGGILGVIILGAFLLCILFGRSDNGDI